MHLKNLAAIYIRLQVLLAVPNLLLAIISIFGNFPFAHNRAGTEEMFKMMGLVLGFYLAQIIVYVLLWIYANRLSDFLSKGFDEPISLQSLTKEQVYIGIFVIVGLLTCFGQLSHIAHLIGPWLVNASMGYASKTTLLVESAVSVIVTALGVWLIVGSRKFYHFLKKFIDHAEEAKQP